MEKAYACVSSHLTQALIRHARRQDQSILAFTPFLLHLFTYTGGFFSPHAQLLDLHRTPSSRGACFPGLPHIPVPACWSPGQSLPTCPEYQKGRDSCRCFPTETAPAKEIGSALGCSVFPVAYDMWAIYVEEITLQKYRIHH